MIIGAYEKPSQSLQANIELCTVPTIDPQSAGAKTDFLQSRFAGSVFSLLLEHPMVRLQRKLVLQISCRYGAF